MCPHRYRCLKISGNDIIFQAGGAPGGRYDGGITKWVFEKDVLLDSGSRIRSFDSTEIGLFVTNFTGSVGTAGSNQGPSIPSLTPSKANLDNTFGSAVGCWGVFNTSTAFVNVAWKDRSDEWVVIAIPDGGGNVLGEHFN